MERKSSNKSWTNNQRWWSSVLKHLWNHNGCIWIHSHGHHKTHIY
jgi:hypothetical protein